MGFVKDTIDGITGKSGERAAKKSGKILSAAAESAQDDIRASESRTLSALRGGASEGQRFLTPFTQAGVDQLGSLQQGFDDVQGDISGVRGLVTDPNQQASFVQNNPFFTALADDAQRRIFGSQAARGKLGSGGTAEALQNSLLLLGNDLLGQNIQQRQGLIQSGLGLNQQRQNLTSLGANAASRQAGISENLGINTANTISGNARNIADLKLQGAGAQASGLVGAAQARQQGIENMIKIGSEITKGIAASDRRVKENITFVKKIGDVPYYFFNYIGDDEIKFGTMAQDVEHIPGAVIDMGVKYVNYARL